MDDLLYLSLPLTWVTNNFGYAAYKEELSDAMYCEFRAIPHSIYDSEQTCQILPIIPDYLRPGITMSP